MSGAPEMLRRRVLLLGTGPLLDGGARVVSGQCLRTWHFAAPLLAAGHEVVLLTVPIPGTTAPDGAALEAAATYQGHGYTAFQHNAEHLLLPALRAAIARHQPDVLVGVNAYPVYLLARLGTGLPLWADLNGWTMAEGQTRAAIVGHDGDFGHFWRQEAAALLAADRFSTATQRQAWALQGEMAMLGRLVAGNFAEQFVHAVPNAVYPSYAAIRRSGPRVPDFLAGDFPPGARLCLWTGGFNTWTDVPMLVEGLARAMEAEPAACFVSTGGAVIGHEESTYERFLALAAARFPAGRWKALGWTDSAHVESLHETAAIGMNIDGDNIETRFGARNRLTNMMAAGLATVTTRGTEIAEWMERKGLGWFVDLGDAGGLAAALVDAVRHPVVAESRGAGARLAALQAFDPARTVAPLLEWVANPSRLGVAPPAGQADPPARLRAWVAQRAAEAPPFATDFENYPSPPLGLVGKLRRRLRSFRRGNS